MKKIYADSDTGKLPGWNTCWRTLTLFSFAIFLMGQFSFARSVFQTSYNSSGAVSLNSDVSSDWNSMNVQQSTVNQTNQSALTPMAEGDVTIQIGTGGTLTSSYVPIYYFYDYSMSEAIYTATELQSQGASAGQINQIAYLPGAGVPTTSWQNWTVYMGNTTKSVFSANTDWSAVSGMQMVFNGNIASNTTANTWMPITLDTSFQWDGTSNIIVAVVDNTVGWTNAPNWKGYNAGSNRAIYAYRDGTPIVVSDPNSGSPTRGITTTLPQIQFIGNIMQACNGTPTPGNTVASTGGNACSSVPFTLSLQNNTSGSGVTYQWQSADDAAFTTGVTAMGTASTQTATQTTPKWYRCTVTCASAGSTTSTPVYVGINPPEECFCVPTTTGGGTYYISNFTTTGGATNINNSSAGSTTGYQDFHNTVSMSAVEGDVINYSISCGGGSNYGRAIWVDWNGDGTFQAGEQVASSTTYDYPPLIGSFSIPAGTTPGNKRMRVLISYTPGNPSNPCANSGGGEYEDYTLQVLQLVGCTGTPEAGTVTGPATICAGVGFTLTAEGASAPADGLHGQWQSSANGSNWVDMQGFISPSLSTNISEPTYFRFTMTCDNTQGSDTTDAFFVGLNPGNECYCTPTYNYTGDRLSSITTTGANTNLNYTNSTGGQHFDQTATVLDTNPGQTFGMTTTYVGGAQTVGVWIDWNGDGNFSNADGERYVLSNSSAASQTFSITIPSGIAQGNYRMRVRGSYDYSNAIPAQGDAFACNNQSYGSSADFTVHVGDALPSCEGTPDGGTAQSSAANGMSGSTVNFSVSGYSTGFDGLSNDWQYSVDGGATWTSTGVSQDNVDFTITGAAGTVFQVRYAVACSHSQQTGYSNEVSFTVIPGCTPSYSSGCALDDYIQEFTLSGDNGSSISRTDGSCDGSYVDNRAQSVDLTSGLSYTGHITAGTSGDKVTIWLIDANWTATLVTPTTAANDGAGSSFNMNLPVMPAGTYTMRVMLTWSSSPTNECTPVSSWGQTIDYTANVGEGEQCNGTPDAGVVALSSSTGAPGSFYGVSLNDYTDMAGITFSWSYRINGGEWIVSNETEDSFTATAPEAVGTTVQWKATVTCTYSGQSSDAVSDIFTVTEPPCTVEFPYSNANGSGNTQTLLFADDFEIAAGTTMSVNKVSIRMFNNIGIASTISIYADNDGQPAATPLATFSNVAPDGQVQIDSNFGMNIYDIIFTLPSNVDLGEGIYWFAFQNTIGTDGGTNYWVITESTFGQPGKYSNDGGANWTVNSSALNYSFTLMGDCGDDSGCPNLNTAPANVTVFDSVIGADCIPTGMYMILPPENACPEGSFIQYSTNNGHTWKNNPPAYNLFSPITIITRCSCEADETVFSPSSAPVTTNPQDPGACADASYAITTQPTPTQGGTTTGDGTYAWGTQATVKATANFGYSFEGWMIGSTVVATTTSFKFPVFAAGNVKAKFVKKEFSVITKSAPAAGGTTTGDGMYAYNTKATVTATANAGYSFINWTDNDGNVLSTAGTFKVTVLGPTKVTANFAPASYTVITKSTPNIGGTTTGDGSYVYNTKATVKATPNTGYSFVNWTDNSGNILSIKTSYKFNVLGNTTVTANFAPKSFLVTTKSAPNAGGTTTGDGSYVYNTKATVKATANFGYVFVNWTDTGGNVLSTASTFKVTVLGPTKVTANFAPKDYTLTTKSAPAAGGTTTGDGTYAYGTKVQVTATANQGYSFVNWTVNGEEVSNKRSFKYQIQGNVKLTANFVQNGSGFGEKGIESDIFSYYPNPVKDILYINTNNPIQSLKIYNLASQEVMSLNAAKTVNGKIDVKVLPQGVYVFRAVLDNGDIKTFKVVKK